MHRGRQAEVEERGATGNVHRAAGRVAVGQLALRVGVEFDCLAGLVHPESPWLGVVHGWRGHSRLQQVINEFASQFRPLR
jgi:hypothetical protein